MLTCRIEELIKGSGYKKAFIAGELGISVRQLREYEKMESLLPKAKCHIYHQPMVKNSLLPKE